MGKILKKEIPMQKLQDSFEERLKFHPYLAERFETILRIVEDTADEIKTADEAEQRVTEELRRLGNDVLKEWIVQKEEQKVKEYKEKAKSKRHGKKKLFGIRHMEK